MPLLEACAIYTPNGFRRLPVDCTRGSTVQGGVATFYLTTDGTANGDPIYSEVFPTTASFEVRDATALYQTGAVTVSSDRKTLTVPVTKQQFNGVVVLNINVVGSASMVAAPNGTVVDMMIEGVV